MYRLGHRLTLGSRGAYRQKGRAQYVGIFYFFYFFVKHFIFVIFRLGTTENRRAQTVMCLDLAGGLGLNAWVFKTFLRVKIGAPEQGGTQALLWFAGLQSG